MDTLNTADRSCFLARYAPFDALSPEELETVAATAGERVYRPGEVALLEDGPPSEYLYVIREGSMELDHDGEPPVRSGIIAESSARSRQRR